MFKNLIDYLKNLCKKKEFIEPDHVDHPDPMTREGIARCFNTGNVVLGNRNEDGTWEIEEIKNEQR